MTLYAETLSPQLRRKSRLYAYFSTYTGCISEVMLDSSAIVILFLNMIGCNGMMVMLSTGFSGIAHALLFIPCAGIACRIGMKRAVSIACLTGCSGFLLMAAAPFFGAWQQWVAVAGCLIYNLQRPLYSSTWSPLINGFLLPEERGSFFGTMRYSYMLVSGILFYFIGKLMGENPSLLLLQTVIGISGLLLLGRMYCMRKFPEDPAEKVSRLKFGHALQMAVRNSMLMGYAIYACLISIAYTSMIPLTLIYLREYVGVNAGAVQTFSTVGIAGNIAAFFCYGYISRHFRLKSIELVVHFMFLFSAAAMALVPSGIAGFIWIAGVIYFGVSFAASTFMCNNSMELMALARPGNKPMAMAFLQSYQNIGVCIGRMGTALIMGANLLAAEWSLGGLTVSHYQTLFLFYGIIAAVLLVLFPALPSIVPKHKDYYAP